MPPPALKFAESLLDHVRRELAVEQELYAVVADWAVADELGFDFIDTLQARLKLAIAWTIATLEASQLLQNSPQSQNGDSGHSDTTPEIVELIGTFLMDAPALEPRTSIALALFGRLLLLELLDLSPLALDLPLLRSELPLSLSLLGLLILQHVAHRETTQSA